MNEQIVSEYLHDLSALKQKAVKALADGEGGITPERLALCEIEGYCNGAAKRIKYLYGKEKLV
jgi:hypothetical protein